MDSTRPCPRTSEAVARIAGHYLASTGISKRLKSVVASDLRQRANNRKYKRNSGKRD